MVLSAVQNGRPRKAGGGGGAGEGRRGGDGGAVLARGSEKAAGAGTFKRRLQEVKEKLQEPGLSGFLGGRSKGKGPEAEPGGAPDKQ